MNADAMELEDLRSENATLRERVAELETEAAAWQELAGKALQQAAEIELGRRAALAAVHGGRR